MHSVYGLLLHAAWPGTRVRSPLWLQRAGVSLRSLLTAWTHCCKA